jgi:cobyrinic acid a,c-diamide synthase
MKAFLVAGTASGVGKTTVTLALLAALRERGLRVQPFKAGPDFIDPGHHEAISGVPSRTLDGWMVPAEENRRIFWRAAGGRDVAIVEGMMGLFDGVEGGREEGSSAALAKLLGLPVVLVIDAAGAVRSAAAMLRGFRDFDPALRLAGVVFNRVGGPAHLADLRAAAAPLGVPVLGGVPWEPATALPERHLGLVTAAETWHGPEAVRHLAALARDHLDLARLLAGTEVQEPRTLPPDAAPVPPRIRVAVARDVAFSFYYRENLARLAAAGAELVDWSPLADGALPPGTRALYLGGGYPELHAAQLAANAPARAAVRTFAEAGGVVYAECGGLMYLSHTLRTLDGGVHPMCGVLPLAVRMRPTLAALGYVEVSIALGDGPPLAARGHLFHHSELEAPAPPTLATAYEVRDPRGAARAREGYRVGRTLASYVHLHFASCPELPARLLTLAGDVR